MTLEDLKMHMVTVGKDSTTSTVEKQDIRDDIIKTCSECEECSEQRKCKHNWITNTAGYMPFTYCYDCGLNEGEHIQCERCKALMEWAVITEDDLR